MDVHEWHCNTEIKESATDKKFNSDIPDVYLNDLETGTQGVDKKYSRLSFVCYLREKLRQCKDSQTRKYFKTIGFNPKTMRLTRKKRTVTESE
jgi:hypothetical protein